MTEDILERAKKADIDLMAITDWGQLRDLFGELIAEIERLRSENKIISDRAAHHDRQDAKEIELLAARIAELEASLENAEALVKKNASAMNRQLKINARLEAAFLKLYVNQLVGCNMPREVAEKQACDALKRIKEEREG